MWQNNQLVEDGVSVSKFKVLEPSCIIPVVPAGQPGSGRSLRRGRYRQLQYSWQEPEGTFVSFNFIHVYFYSALALHSVCIIYVKLQLLKYKLNNLDQELSSNTEWNIKVAVVKEERTGIYGGKVDIPTTHYFDSPFAKNTNLSTNCLYAWNVYVWNVYVRLVPDSRTLSGLLWTLLKTRFLWLMGCREYGLSVWIFWHILCFTPNPKL